MQNIFTNRSLHLQAGQTHALQARRPLCLTVTSGRVWITIEGGSTDYWLAGGQSLDIPGQGLVVIESVNSASRMRIGLCRRHWLVRLRTLAGRYLSLRQARPDKASAASSRH